MFIQRVGNLSIQLAHRSLFTCGTFRLKSALLQSHYHRLGPPTLHIAHNLKKLLSPHLTTISSIQKKLDSTRTILLKSQPSLTEEELTKLTPEIKIKAESYFVNYQELITSIKNCPLNNQWVYQLIGWYNMHPYYKTMVERLIEAGQDQLLSLVKALSQMTYQWDNPYGIIDQDLFRQQNISSFYKRIKRFNLDIPTLRMLDKILVVPVNFFKRKFYSNYLHFNVHQLLKYVSNNDPTPLSNLIWLMKTYTTNMNDDEMPIITIERYLTAHRPPLKVEDLQNLLSTYQLRGRINKATYISYIKPYILRTKMTRIQDLIQMVKFTICSESGDNQLLKNLYELISSQYQERKISSSRHTYTLHLYTHYLLTKGYTIKLPPTLKKELTIFCKQRADGRTNVNRLLKKNKQKTPKAKKFSSPCLQPSKSTIVQLQPTPTSTFQSQFAYKLKFLKLPQYRVLQKPILCCFQLDYLLSHKTKNQLINIQIQGIQYVFTSGRLIRQRQIRDQMLQYYGIKVNHLDYNSFKGNTGFDQDQLMMNRRI